jgi:nucleotide-binding universal stress UspA family protein
MIKSILIPTDGSENSKTALEYGMYLSGHFKAEITGLNVIDIRALEGPFFSDISGSLGFIPYQNYLPKYQSILEERAKIILDTFKKTCEEKLLPCKTRQCTGIIPNIIAEEGKKVDIIIMAQRGEHAQWSSGLLGSTTESVVRKAPRPVMVTPQQFHPFSTVLAPYDGSSESNKALKIACEFVFSMKLPFRVLVVTNSEEKGDEIAREAEEFIGPYQLNAKVEWVKGEAHDEILDYAGQNAIDLIIMGAFGHSRVRELILGGTTAYIVRKSPVPVLLYR